MPEKEKRKLKAQAAKLGLKRGSLRWGAYVYGTLAKIEKRRKEKRKS